MNAAAHDAAEVPVSKRFVPLERLVPLVRRDFVGDTREHVDAELTQIEFDRVLEQRTLYRRDLVVIPEPAEG